MEKATVSAFPVERNSLSMPTHIPTELKLDVPICEEDIGDLSPFSVPLSGFRTTNSSYSINSSLSRHEVASAVPYSGNDIHRMLVLETPMRGIFDVCMLVIYSSPFANILDVPFRYTRKLPKQAHNPSNFGNSRSRSAHSPWIPQPL